MKLLSSLEKKLVNMELRHQSREQELQQVQVESETSLDHAKLRTCPLLSWQVIGRSWQTSESGWRREAENKKRELDSFRQELDSILDILRYLQREGVVFCVPATSTTHILNELS